MATTITTLPPPDMARLPLATHMSGMSRSRLYRLAGEGRIRFVRVGGATLVDMASVRTFLASLPAAAIHAPKKPA